MKKSKLAVVYCVHDDTCYLEPSIRSVEAAGPVFVFTSRVARNNDVAGDWEAAVEAARSAGAEVVVGDWKDEVDHRRAANDWLVKRGFTHALTPDGDEIVEPQLLAMLGTLARHRLAERVTATFETYWKTPEFVIRPRESIEPVMLIDLQVARPEWVRQFSGGRALHLSADYGIVHHLSYLGPDARIQRKIATGSHQPEVLAGWYEHVWLPWDQNRRMRNLHPTHPTAYGFAERIPVPEVLQETQRRWRELTQVADAAAPPTPAPKRSRRAASTRGEADDLRPTPATRRSRKRQPRVSVVIPLHGGVEEIRVCLESLAHCHDLLHEVIVVDDRSPDEAPAVAAAFEGVRVITNEGERGFAATSNLGLKESSGELVLFLNSDTVVPRVAIERMLECLQSSGSIGAVGPYSNRAAHLQAVFSTYTTLDHLDLFAEDFAQHAHPDVDTDMLVGFCLLVRRNVLKEVGSFDTAFGLGNFEDNDLSYRIRRAGYRLAIAGRAFVHHHGGRSLARLPESTPPLLEQNEVLFRTKWREDVECGFASHLSGYSPERILFDPSRNPDTRRRELRERAQRASITLCVAATRDSERLIEIVAPLLPYFREVVVVDLGASADELAPLEPLGVTLLAAPGAGVAAAANMALATAKGKWVMWVGPDQQLTVEGAACLLDSVLTVGTEVRGISMRVPLLAGGPETQVLGELWGEQVQLFRRRPTPKWTGRAAARIELGVSGEEQIRHLESAVLKPTTLATEAWLRRREENLQLLRMEAAEHPEDNWIQFCLGVEAHHAGQHAEAVTALQAYIAGTQGGDRLRMEALCRLIASLRMLEQGDQCLATLYSALAIFPDAPELAFQAGELMADQGRFWEARDLFMRCAHQITAASGAQHRLAGNLFYRLGRLAHMSGEYNEARDWWKRTLSASPSFLPAALDLFENALGAGDLNTSQQMLQEVRRIEGPGETWATLAARYAETVGGPDNADLWLARAVGEEPDATGPRLLLTRRLLQAGREGDAAEHLRVLDRKGIAEATFYLGIASLRTGDPSSALRWMERAHDLNPQHAETARYLSQLRGQGAHAAPSPLS